jgi:hypothetical protein
MKTTSLTILATVLVSLSARAAYLTPIDATTPNVADATAPLSSMINHLGLTTGGDHTSTYRDGSIYYHWRTQEAANTVEATFDLGAHFDLDKMRVWNYNEAGQTNRGIQTMNVSFSSDGLTFGSSQSVTLSAASGFSTYAGAEYTFSSLGQGYRYIKFDVSSNLGGDRTGLSEVRFNTTTTQIIPVSVSANQTANAGTNFAVDNLINNSGMTGFGNEQSTAHTVPANSFLWRQDGAADGNVIGNSVLTFDLGSKQEVGAVKIWNYHELTTNWENDRGLQNIELYQSDDGSTYTKVGDYTVGQQLNQNLSVDHTVLDLFGEGVNAQYLQIRATDNYGDAYYGLGEVRFFGASTIPEPSTVALLLGVGGLALLLRRRRVGVPGTDPDR